MLPFPPNKSTLHEFESFGEQADSPQSVQYLYSFHSSVSFSSTLDWHSRSFKAPQRPRINLRTSQQVRVLQEAEDPELHLAAPKTMAQCTANANPGKVIQNAKANVKDPRTVPTELASAAAVKVRPADLGLIRSLSKSDSDLLASPLGEEDGGLAGRSGSVSNCSSGQPSIERMPSFASEWDEVTNTRALGMGNKWEGAGGRGSGTLDVKACRGFFFKWS